MPRLTKQQRTDAGNYARVLADRIGLREWTVHIMHAAIDPEGDDNPHAGANNRTLARVECVYGRRHAYIYLNPDYFEHATRDEQRAIMLHELLHCSWNAAQDVVRIQLKGEMSRATYDAIYEAYVQQSEYAIDNLADNIARLLPYPQFA